MTGSILLEEANLKLRQMLKSFLMVWRKNIKFSLSDIILKIGGGKFWLKSCRKVPGCQRCIGKKMASMYFVK